MQFLLTQKVPRILLLNESDTVGVLPVISVQLNRSFILESLRLDIFPSSFLFVTEKATTAGCLDLNNFVQCLFRDPETTKLEL